MRVTVVAGLLASTFTFGSAAGATVTDPMLSARVANTYDDVRVSWSYGADGRGDRVVEVERSLDGGPFEPVFERARAPKRASFVDRNVPTRYATYRARVRDGEHTTPWSAPLVVDTMPPLKPGTAPCPSDWVERGLAEINRFRAANGTSASQRRALVAEVHLMRLAHVRASRNARIQRLSHAGFGNGLLVRWGYTLARDGAVAENAVAIVGPEGIDDAWAGSPGHRTNMLRGAIDAGLGCAYGSDGIPYWILIVGVGVLSPSSTEEGA
jgi:hypothetical protein